MNAHSTRPDAASDPDAASTRQYRHGDLLIEAVEAIPADAKCKPGLVLAEGEATGHAHRLRTDDPADAKLFEGKDGTLYLTVRAPELPLVHEEHDTIVLPHGDYIVTRQRQYDPYEDVERYVWD
jgi:hypothetical protein